MKNAIKIGVNFGITSGIITTLGLLVGLSGTQNKRIIFAGIITIAIADALSDALGIHISEEGDKKNTQEKIWNSTISTLLTKFLTASTFLIPLIFFSIKTAILINIFYGLLLLSFVSYKLAKKRKEKPINAISEHLFIAIIVILITYRISLFL